MTKFPANHLPKIWIASKWEASQLLASETGDAIAHIISIGEPGTSPPKGYTKVPHRLRLEFTDIVALNDDELDYVLATSEHIRQVIDFVPIISQEGGDVLVHCQAGISRSSAVALT
ncbi:dual specificity protein phosphatase family protein, partial [Coleofasciculus sp.]